jgi:non-canonical purine NTP pyrophosphatase (RdgB/HAM1 family)
MVLYFITGNKNKFLEAQKELMPIEIEQRAIDLVEIQSLDPQETIEHKLNEAKSLVEGEFFVEDVSINLDALNGFPGPLIKWFIGAIGREGIYELCKMKNNFGAKAVATIGYSNGKEMNFFSGEIFGTVVEPKVDSNFGWDPTFKPNGFNKTFAEMTKEEKNAISHRGKAVRDFKEWYLKKNK